MMTSSAVMLLSLMVAAMEALNACSTSVMLNCDTESPLITTVPFTTTSFSTVGGRVGAGVIGLWVGLAVGLAVGAPVGLVVGAPVGAVGLVVGAVGLTVGALVGLVVGALVGAVGLAVGLLVGGVEHHTLPGPLTQLLYARSRIP